MKIKTLTGIIFLTFSSFSFSQSIDKTFETTAKIENFCKIETNDINFGVLASPLTAQSANAKMNVLCSNNTAYKIDLSYSAGLSGGNVYTSETLFQYQADANIRLLVNGEYISPIVNKDSYDIHCSRQSPGRIYIQNKYAFAFYYGEDQNSVLGWQSDPKRLCEYNNVNQSNLSNGTWYVSNPLHGTMKGLTHKDRLVYKITLPNDSTKVWSRGNNHLSATGNGVLQQYDMNAQIIPNESSSLYVAADTYASTVTAEITY